MFEQRKIRKDWRRREQLSPTMLFHEDISRTGTALLRAEMNLAGLIKREDRAEVEAWLRGHHDAIQKLRFEFDAVSDLLIRQAVTDWADENWVSRFASGPR